MINTQDLHENRRCSINRRHEDKSTCNISPYEVKALIENMAELMEHMRKVQRYMIFGQAFVIIIGGIIVSLDWVLEHMNELKTWLNS